MKSLRLPFQLLLLAGLLAGVTQTLSPSCTAPFTELPYSSGTYCAKCDTTCATCSGTSINSCASCYGDFTLNSNTSTCTAPNNNTVNTVASLYHGFGFQKQSTWSGGDASSWSLCGTITVLHGNQNSIISTSHSLSPHYKLRLRVAVWWFDSNTAAIPVNVLSGTTVIDAVNTPGSATPTGTGGWISDSAYPYVYCNGSMATNFDLNVTDANSASSVNVKFGTTASTSWGIAEYVFIQYLCSQPDCATCKSDKSTECYSCSDSNKKIYAGTFGPCLCKYQTGYYAYPTGNSTYYCVNPCPNYLATGQYYGDNTTKTCVLTCPTVTGAPMWGLTFASDQGGICVTICNSSILLGSQSFPLYYDKTNRKCTMKCPTTQPYSWTIDRACYSTCPSNSGTQYYKLNTNMTCVSFCPNITQDSNVNIPLFIDNTTNTCVTQCDDSKGYWGYLDPSSGVMSCILNCPTNYFTDLSSGRPLCTKKCPSPQWYGDYNTLPPSCVQICTFGTYGDNSNDRYCVAKCNNSQWGLRTGTQQCVDQCPSGTWGQPNTMSCATYAYQCMNLTSNPFSGSPTFGGFVFSTLVYAFADSANRKCLYANTSCSIGQFKQNTTYMCMTSCPSGTYANNVTYWCVDKCYGSYYADNTTNQCVMVCPPDYFADKGSKFGNKCVYQCNQTGGYPFRDSAIRQCVAICSSGAGYADPMAQSCAYNCTPPLYLNDSVSTELTCVSSCASPYFAYNNTDSGICLLTCPDYPPLFGDVVNGVRICVQVCQVGKYGDQTSGSYRWCVPNCPSGTFAQNDSLRRCVTLCNSTTYGNKDTWTCVDPLNCPTNFTGDPTTQLCVDLCPPSNGTFADNITKMCVAKCPIQGTTYYYADSHTRWCIPTCNSAYNEFGNNSTQTCEVGCLDRKSFADAVNSRRYCIATCTWSGAVIYYRNNQTSVCVVSTGCTGTYVTGVSVSFSQQYFADNSTLYCVQKCPNVSGVPSWGYLPTLTCVSLCYGSTWGDNSTGIPLCVSLCSQYPTPLWSYNGPNDKSIMLCVSTCPSPYFGEDYLRTCVQQCPRANGSHAQTYAYNVSRRCLLNCPDGTWADYITGVCFHVPINCTAPCAYTNSSCSTYRWADDYNNSCVFKCNASPYNYFGDNVTQKCTGLCTTLSYADNYTGTRICVKRCPGTYSATGVPNGLYDSYGDNYTQGCVLYCQQPSTYADWQLSLCLSRCMGDDPMWVPTYANIFNRRCVISLYCPVTPDLYFGQNITRSCVPACPLNTSYVSFADNITRACIPQCYRFTNSTNSLVTRFYGDTSKKRPMCVISCAAVPRQFGKNQTNLCVTQCPNHQYGDQTGNRSCVPVCPNIAGTTWFSQLTERLCVLVCENGTWGNYYNYVGPHCETVGTDCNATYYGDNSTHMCVPLCPQSMNYFGQPHTRLCTDRCPYLNASTMILVNASAGINLVQGRLFADYSTRLCVYTCPASVGLQGTFGDNNTNTCVLRCPTSSFGDANTVNRVCVATCTGGSFADNLTNLCVKVCPASPPTFGYQGNWTCLNNCPSNLWADSSSRLCVPTCSNNKFRFTNINRTCVQVCPSTPDLYGDTITYNCTATCTAAQYADPFSRLCTTSCLPRFMYNFRCVLVCPKGYFARSTGECVVPTSCDSNTYGDNSTTKCVLTCPAGSYSDPTSRFCIAVCPDGTFGDNLKCVTGCTTANTIASNITQICASICPNYTYSYNGQCYQNCTGSTYQNDQTHLCDTSCPSDMYADPTTHRCVTYCPTGYYRQKSGTNLGFCVLASSGCNPLFSDFVTGNCTAMCSTGYWGYTGNYTCNPTCPSGLYGYASSSERTCYAPLNLPASAPMLFADSVSGQFVAICPTTPNITYGDRNRQTCVSVCQPFSSTVYYGDPSTRQCEYLCKSPALYTADPATKLCTLKCTYGTFRDNNTANSPQNPQCVSNCSLGFGDFTTRMCVDFCSIFTQTFGHTNQSYKVCLSNCPADYYAQNVTRTCTPACPTTPSIYFAYNNTRTCVLYCNQSYADLSNGRCMDKCWSSNYPNADNSTNRCVPMCPTNPDYYSDSHVCVYYCTTPNFYADPNGRACRSRCTNFVGYKQYGDPRTGRCQMNCSEGTWGDNDTNLCVSTCPPNSFADNTTGKCVASCPVVEAIYADPLLHVCAPTCSGGYFGSQLSQTCIPVCDMGYYGDPTTTLCTSLCPVKIYSYGENVTRTCTPTCLGFVGPNGIIGYADNYSRICRDKCQNTLPVQTFADPTTKACVQICPQTYFAENTTNTCMQKCPNTTFADNFSSYCVAQCPDNPQSYGDTILNICTYQCLRGQFSDNSTNLCVVQCPGPTPVDYYGDRHTGRCVKWCTQGTYARNASRLCVATCNGGEFADNLTRRCVTNCPPSQWTYADSTTHRCVRICPLGWYAENTTQACKDKCWNYSLTNQSYADKLTNFCVAKCPFGYFGDNRTHICVTECGSPLYGHHVGRVCVALLDCYPDNSTGKIYYADQTSRTCVQKCPLSLWADRHTRVCVPACDRTKHEYRNLHDQTCVWPCPSDPDEYADDSNYNCVRKCAPNTYAYATTNNRTCQPSCAPFSLYADNTTNRCVLECATLPYLYADSLIWKCVHKCSGGYFADNRTQTCVAVCPALWATFGELVNYTCVSLCPEGTYADALLNRTCRATCSGGYFADSFTSTCVAHCKAVRPFWYEDTSSGYGVCVSICPGESYAYLPDQTCKYLQAAASTCPGTYHADRLSRRCRTFCPANYYSFITTKYCESKCSGTYYADPVLRKCVTSCSKNLFKHTLDATSNLCVQYCPSPLFALNSSTGVDAACVPTCTGLLALNTTRTCQAYCPLPFWGDWTKNLCVTNCTPRYSYHPNRTCLQVCQEPYYGNPLTMTCDLLCPQGYYGINSTRMCSLGCPSNSFADPSIYICVLNCPSYPALYAHSDSHMCLPGCSTPYFAYDYTRSCQTSCPNLTIGVKFYQYLADPYVRRCVLQCNNELISFADFTTNICTKKCPSGFYANNYTKECVRICPNVPLDTFSDNVSRICMDVCLPGSFGYSSSLNCVQNCWWPYFADPTTRRCVKFCPNGYFSDNFTATCGTTCPTNSFADPVTHRCLAQCPALARYFNYAANWTCLQNCPASYYANTDLQQCVSICNSSTGMFAYPVTNLCVRQCPIPYRGFAPNSTCVLYCPTENYFYDVTINVCALCDVKCLICASLSACTKCLGGYNLFNGYCNQSCIPTTIITYANAGGQCVAKCPAGTFGNNQTYACVTVCPPQQYGQTSTNLCTLCPSTCSVCSNLSYCIACIPAATLAIDHMCYSNCNATFKYSYNGSCWNVCPDGTYLTYTNVLCSVCAAKCLTCSGDPNNCTSCSASYYYNKTCLKVCPQNYFGNSTTLQCVSCLTVPASVCSKPLSYTTSYSVQNYQGVITLQFNQNVSLADQLQNILKIRIQTRRLLQVGSIVNNGVNYTYEILSNGTIKIYLDTGTSLSNPTFSVDITNPAAVVSNQTGLSLQNVQSLLTVPKVDYYLPSDGEQAPTNFVAVFVVVGVLLLYALTFFFSDVMVRPLQVLQLFFLHSLINAPVSANIYYLLAGLKISTLNFITNWFGSSFPSPSPYYDVPLIIKNALVDYIFLRNVGQILVMIVVALCFWFVFLMLGNKRIMRHKIWFGFFNEVSEKRFQLMLINDIISLFFLPIMYFGFFQLSHLYEAGGIYAANGTITLIFLVLAILVPIAWAMLWCRRTPEQIHNRLWFLTLRIKVPADSAVIHEEKSVERLKQISEKSDPAPQIHKNPKQFQTIAFYIYLLLCAIWMTALYNYTIPQLVLLLATNFAFLAYLLKARPYINSINLVFMILFTLTSIGIQSFGIYFYKTDAATFAAQKSATGYPFVLAICVVLILLLLWSVWRVVWEVSFLLSKFKKTQLYLQFVDHDYVGEKQASQKYSQYDQLAQKLQTGVGDLVVDKIKEEVNSSGEKVIRVTKKKLVKKVKVQGRKKGILLPQEENHEEFVRVNQINIFDFGNQPEQSQKIQEPPSPPKHKKDIDDDLRDVISIVSDQIEPERYNAEQQEKKIDIEPGETLIQNIEQLSQIGKNGSEKQSEFPFVEVHQDLSEEQKKQDQFSSQRDADMYDAMEQLQVKPAKGPDHEENNHLKEADNVEDYQQMKSESFAQPIPNQEQLAQKEQENMQHSPQQVQLQPRLKIATIQLEQNAQQDQAEKEQKPKKVMNIEDLLQQEQGKKKNLLFLFDDFDQEQS